MWRYCVLFLLFVATEAVSAGSPARIYICPGDVTLSQRVQQQFQVFGVDSEGNDVPVTGLVTWSADPTVGAITQTGLFTANAVNGRSSNGVTASIAGGLTATGVIEVVSRSQQGGFLFEKSWGGAANGHLNDPQGVVVAPNGSVYVVDTMNHRVQRFDSSGNFLSTWGSYGSSNGQFLWPNGIDVDSSGNIYVADQYNYRIQKFSANGSFLAKWGSAGTGNGQFFEPSDVAIDSSGNVFVADEGNNRIQKFTSSGTYVTKWGSLGTGNGQFDTPSGIAVDASNNVYVSEYSNNRVQKFNASGTYLMQWGSPGHNNGQFDCPLCIEVDHNGIVYVGDSQNHRIQVFDGTGKYIYELIPSHEPNSYVTIPGAISVDGSGNIYVVDVYEHSVRKFDSAGVRIAEWGAQWNQKGQFHHVESLACDRHGNLYALDAGNSKVQKFDSTGSFITQWGSPGYGDTKLDYPNAIAVGPDDSVYVSENGQCRIKKYDSNGSFITKWGGEGTADGQFIYPWGLDVDANNNVYVADNTRHIMQKFDSSGRFIAKWGSQGTGDQQFSSGPRSVGVAANGDNYAVDYSGNKILVFDSNGKFIQKITYGGPNPSSYWRPWNATVGPDGRVYVADGYRMEVYSATRNYISEWGSYGSDIGEFWDACDVEVDDFGCVYVADAGNNRVQKFVPVTSSLGLTKHRGNGELVSLTGQVVTAGSSELGDCFYVETEDRLCGIKVTGKAASRGAKVAVTGVIATVNGEREIQATSVTVAGSGTISPIALSNKALGGGDALLEGQPETGQQGIAGAAGLSNIGLLIRAVGRVTYLGSDFFYVDDGSGLDDGSGYVGVRVAVNGFAPPPAGIYVSVTGISSTFTADHGLQRLIRTRSSDDVKILSGAVISGKVAQASGIVPTVVESAHPYSNNYDYTWTITGPSSATSMRVHFSTIDLEYSHDYLSLLNGAGVQQAKYSTAQATYDYWSKWVTGNTIKLRLTSDASGTRYGFRVDQYEVGGAPVPVAGVTLTVTPGGQSVVSDANGDYQFVVFAAGTYTVTPSRAGATFTPANRGVAVSQGQTMTGVDFVRD